MDHLRSLRCVSAVADSGSTSAAAQKLHVSQSSVVRAVQSLEQALGSTLFERSSQGMNATAVGAELSLRAHRALMLLAQGSRTPRQATPGTSSPPLAWLGSRLALGVTSRHLNVLLGLAQAPSEASAARALGISQSAVHQTLTQLEHMAGAPLFLRVRTGLRPTEAGDALLLSCKLARAELEQAADTIAAQHGVVQGRLVIGTLPFSTGRLLSEAVDQLLRAHPLVGVTIIDGTYDMLLQQLRQADIDVMVGALRPTPALPELAQEVLFLDRLAVIARAGHPLTGKPGLSWQDLQASAWIMPMPHTPAQAAFDQALALAGLPVPADSLRVNSALMMQALLTRSDRLALMSPRQLQAEIQAGLLVELAIPVQHAARSIGMVTRKAYRPAPAASYLLTTLRSVAQQIS